MLNLLVKHCKNSLAEALVKRKIFCLFIGVNTIQIPVDLSNVLGPSSFPARAWDANSLGFLGLAYILGKGEALVS